MVVHVHVIDFADLIAADIGYTAKPIPEIIGRRSAASVEIEIPQPRKVAGLGAQIGIAYECVYLRDLLRFCRQARKRSQEQPKTQ